MKRASLCAFFCAVVVVAVGVSVGCKGSGAPMSRTRVVIDGAGDKDVAVVEAAVSAVAGVNRVRSVVCADHAVVVVDGGDVGEAVRGAQAKLSAQQAPQVTQEANEIVVFRVGGADAFAARVAVDKLLRPALSTVPGIKSIAVRGGKTGRRVELDLASLLLRDVTVGEAVAVVGGPASLETMVVKTVTPQPESLSMQKAALPPAQPGDVKLTDVARVGTLPVGEPLRRDGAVEVRVFGDAARAAVVDAANGVVFTDGVVLAVIDDDNVEEVDVIVPAAVSKDDVHRAIAAIPGVRVKDDDTALAIVVDDARVRALGVDKDAVDRVVAVAKGGLTVMRNTENVVVVLQGPPSVELLSQLVVSRTPAGPVRLFDVATLSLVPARRERLNGQPASRLALTLAVGVRKNALASLDERLRPFAGVVVDRRGVSCD